MTVRSSETGRLDWHLPLYATLAAIFVFIPLVVSPNGIDVLYLFVVVPGLILISIGTLIRAAILKKLKILLIVVIFWAVLGSLLAYEIKRPVEIRSAIRWLVGAHEYKNEVFAQPPSTKGDLKHIEWDGWGFAGEDTTVYLVFDPLDGLSEAAKSRQPGKFIGIPCEVPLVHRAERDWYFVRFYTDQTWDRCN